MDKRDKLHLRGSDLDWADWFKSPHTKIVIELIEDIKIHKLEYFVRIFLISFLLFYFFI